MPRWLTIVAIIILAAVSLILTEITEPVEVAFEIFYYLVLIFFAVVLFAIMRRRRKNKQNTAE